MGKIIKNHKRHQFRPTPYGIPSNRYALEKNDWEQAICSVCLEAPHHAVLLLCSSHDKGCRPYMCATDFRHSNCLDLFKKYYAKPAVTASSDPQQHLISLKWPSCNRSDPTELSCPLCRGRVKGWTVVEPARRYLNEKKRSCMQDGCSLFGTYKELKKHMKAKHRQAKPWKVDPVLEEKWKAFETRTEREDVISTIRSSMPGALVWGDYAVEADSSISSDTDDSDDNIRFGESDDDYDDAGNRSFLRARRNNRYISQRIYYIWEDSRRAQSNNGPQEEVDGNDGVAAHFLLDEDDFADDGGRSQGRPVVLTRDRRRRRRRGRASRREMVDPMA